MNRDPEKIRATMARGRKPCRHANRGGMAVVLILGLISIALAVSFAMMRSQVTTLQLQANSTRQSAARQAANTGISAALQAIHDTSWAGVGSTLSRQINATDSYSVTFNTGDPSLSSGDPDWAEYPYRVTLTATGYSADPANPALRATHRVRAVVQLVRRQTSSRPSNWANLQNHTIYQWGGVARIDMPFRAEGPLHLQGPLDLFDEYPHVSKPFDGVIDEVAVFHKALSAAELQAIYDAALNASSGHDAMATAYGTHNPAAWWRFDETAGAATAVDQTGSHNGAYVGARAGASGAPNGVSNTAARFDGINDYVDVGTMDVAKKKLTILAWFNANNFGAGDGRIISKATGTSTSQHYWMLSTINSSGNYRLRFRLRTGGSTRTLIASSGNLSTNQWVFAAAVYDGSQMRLFRNGTQVGSRSKTGNIKTNSNVSVYIGDNPPGSSRARYLQDLERMRAAGMTDWRTFSGPIDTPVSRSPAEDISLVRDDLKVTLNDILTHTADPLSHPGVVSTYQLYPGGKVYNAMLLSGATVSDRSITPDMETNPLGLINVNGGVNLYDNVTIQGTLITNSGSSSPDLRVYGSNVKLAAATIPPLDGSGSTLELPVALIKDDVRVEDNSDSTIRGLMIVWDEYEVKSGHDTVSQEFEGRLLTEDLKIQRRSEWDKGSWWWRTVANAYLGQINSGATRAYFPQWLETQYGLVANPRLQIKPAATPVDYHWQDWSTPLFVPHANDGGLRWDLIQWTDDL